MKNFEYDKDTQKDLLSNQVLVPRTNEKLEVTV